MFLAQRIRVSRLQSRVFIAWVYNHRNGNKIKRKALARLNLMQLNESTSQYSLGQQTSTEVLDWAHNQQQLLHYQVSDTLLLRQHLRHRLNRI